MARRRKPRKGVLLLIVLSLLVLFVLIGTAFIVVASHHEKAAQAAAQVDITGDQPQKILDAALHQLVRGSTHPGSSIGTHDLLNDLYGSDATIGQIWTIERIAQGQLYKIVYKYPPNRSDRRDDYYSGCVMTVVQGSDAKGHSLRIVASSHNDPTVRMTVDPSDAPSTLNPQRPGFGYLLVEATDAPIAGPLPRDFFIINGRPFNGTGGGYNPATQNLDGAIPFPISSDPSYAIQTALLPHHKAVQAYLNSQGVSLSVTETINFGGADEAYDAVDYQNMAIAKNTPLAGQIIPSFHRPALINYWRFRNSDELWDPSNPSFRDIRRMVIMRPMPWDHPNFTGSNPSLAGQWSPGSDGQLGTTDDVLMNDAQLTQNLILASNVTDDGDSTTSQPRFDVDNDFDGIYDSIWLDLGMPVKVAKDGRLYKPLFAILCMDMDGRLNVNAHGNLAQVGAITNRFDNSLGLAAGSPGPQVSRPMGQGVGPAEINMQNIFGGPSYLAALKQRYQSNTPGDFAAAAMPGLAVDDPMSIMKSTGIPNWYEGQGTNLPGDYGSPPDLTGRSTVVLDHLGQPLYQPLLGNLPNSSDDPLLETQNDPYEVNLVDPSNSDSPYTYAELEQILRYQDSSEEKPLLPNPNPSVPSVNRLMDAMPDLAIDPSKRQVVTTASFSMSVPSMIPMGSMRQTLASIGTDQLFTEADRHVSAPIAPATSIVEMARARLKEAGLSDEAIDVQIKLLIPFEVRRGHRMDLNRPWGDGRHTPPTGPDVRTYDPRGVVDDPGETLFMRQMRRDPIPGIPQEPQIAEYTNDYPIDPDLSPLVNAFRTDPRQVYARNLFSLMMLSVDDNYTPKNFRENNLSQTEKRELFVRQVAQWAVNCVDFRDADSIMTPFEYDVNPWNGWQVDGDLRTVNDSPDRRVAWGMEYQELLLTESAAFHDRRVKDTDQAGADDKMRIDMEAPEPVEGDVDLDQVRIPQGSLFLEMYCTRGKYLNNPIAPRELYNTITDGGKTNHYLDLGRLAPQGGDGVQYPVWRVTISEAHSEDAQEEDNSPTRRMANLPDSTSFDPADLSYINDNDQLLEERFIWFTSNASGNKLHPKTYERNRTYFNRFTDARLKQVEAGGYAVVGPARPSISGVPANATSVGWSRTSDAPSQQTFILAPNRFRHIDNQGVEQPAAAVARNLKVTAIAAAAEPPATWRNKDRLIGVNVSEPLPGPGYYDEPNRANRPWDPADSYADPNNPSGGYLDEPLDSDEINGFDPPLADHAPLTVTGTYDDYKTAFLQRLANPLWPWNPETGHSRHDPRFPVNPYVTVDFIPINLTVFNGEDVKPAVWPPAGAEALGDLPFDPSEGEDGEPDWGNVRFGSLHRSAPNQRIWNTAFESQQEMTTQNANDFFRFNLQHSLGYLNTRYGNTMDASVAGPEYLGAPMQRPFPWVTWNNRPYTSPMELLMVPCVSPGRFGVEFTPLANASRDPYDDDSVENYDGPFGHLLNFFATDNRAEDAPNFAAILDALEVPSPFVGTEKFYNERVFKDVTEFKPPFNKFSRFRDPGKVNINTIFDQRTWLSVLGTGAIPYADLERSRRGFSGNMNPNTPTMYANPFRPAGSADLAPLPNLRTEGPRATLLRNNPTDRKRPMFVMNTPQAYHDATRNPYFRYEPLQRLGNLVTTQSNVYAVWITVGYFEVERVPINPAHPDGYRLGAEIGEDTGEIERHRAFYMIDRSIPVAYEPGQNHNVEDAIMLRRFIE